MAETRRLFSTPFVIDQLQSAAGIAALREVIEAEHARDGQGVSISNIGGWHSNTQMIEWGGEAARALAQRRMVDTAGRCRVCPGDRDTLDSGWAGPVPDHVRDPAQQPVQQRRSIPLSC